MSRRTHGWTGFLLALVTFGCGGAEVTPPAVNRVAQPQSSVPVCGTTRPRDFLIIGHKGAPYDRCENTLPSFGAALDQGANALELDLSLTADEQVVLWHDWSPDNVVSLARQTGAGIELCRP